MTLSSIERRLAKLELASMPPPEKKVRMLAEPLEGATDEDRERYARELAEAEAECDMVIILTDLKPLRPYEEGKRMYVGDKTTAQIQMAAHLPSERGHGSLLHDIVQDVSKSARVLLPVTMRKDGQA